MPRVCRDLSSFGGAAVVMGCVLAGGSAGALAQTLAQTDFETDPLAQGWGYTGTLNSVTTEDAYSPTHSGKFVDSTWFSPILTLTPYDYYHVTLKSKITGTGYIGPLENVTAPYTISSGGAWTDNMLTWRAEHGVTDTRVLMTLPNNNAGYIDDVTISHITRAAAADGLDDYYASMHQFDFTNGDANRHQNIPQTMQALVNGDDLRVVMLGDSIVNDTSHGYFEPLVDRMYPGSKMDIVTSVRGNTGAWWYEQENRVQSWVLDYNPDLVMIGGISHHDPDKPANDVQSDIESIRNLIDQIRTADPAIEIILMSEAAGNNKSSTAIDPVNPSGTDYRSLLYQLADDENVGFVDMTAPWTNYIVDSGLPYTHYMRDTIHMNQLGSHIMARTLEAYFAPVPEPSMAGLLACAGALILRRRSRSR